MAGVSAGPDAFFSVKPAELAKPECFAVRREETQQRLDPAFHNTPDMATVISTIHQNTHTIAEFCEFIDSGRPVSQRLCEDGIPAYEVGHILSGELNDTDVWVSPKSDRILERHDLLTGRVGGLGAIAEYESEIPASFSDNVLRLRPKEENKSRSAFVAEYLNSSIGNTQLLRDSRGSLQKVVTQKSLGSIIVPSLGELEIKITANLKAARAERKAKLADADALLAGVDDFVLDALGIVPPTDETRRSFAVRPSQVGGEKRLNAEYYHPERTRALSALQATPENMTSRRLMEVVNFEREQLKTPGENYLSLAHVQGNTGELTDATDTASGNCLAFQTDDVLFARLRPYLNKVYRAEMNGCCSTEFHVLRVKDHKSLLPEYLAAILRSRIALAQTVHMMTGNTHPRLTNYDVTTLTIPIPSMDVQIVIATEVKRRRNEARRLRAEAEAGWDAAKARFEEQLLGSAS